MIIIYCFVLHWAVRQRKQQRADEQGSKPFDQSRGSRRCTKGPIHLHAPAPFCDSPAALCSQCPFLERPTLRLDIFLSYWCYRIITLFSCNGVHAYSPVTYEGVAVAHVATPALLWAEGAVILGEELPRRRLGDCVL